MKGIVYSLAAFAMLLTVFTSVRPADARGGTVVNGTTNRIMVEQFNGRHMPSGELHLAPGQSGTLRTDTASVHAEMSLPGRAPWAQCGTRRAGGTLRVVAAGRHGCRIQ